jgi:subunit length determinant Wzz-like protein
MKAPDPERSGAQTAEAGVLDFLEFIWRKKLSLVWIMGSALILGLLVALLTKPLYSAEAIIAPKEPQKSMSTSGLLSQLSAASGMAAALGGGGASLNKMELLLKSLDISVSVIQENDLLPVLCPDQWDAANGTWKHPDSPPSIRKAAERLRRGILSVTSNPRQNVMTVGVNFPDSVMAKRLVEFFIQSLSRKIRNDIITESVSNRAYLDSQIVSTTDPMLRQKIQELIGMEIEKAMLVSTNSVEVLIPPAVPIERLKPKRKVIMMASFGLGLSFYFMISVLSFFMARNMAVLRGRFRRTKEIGKAPA